MQCEITAILNIQIKRGGGLLSFQMFWYDANFNTGTRVTLYLVPDVLKQQQKHIAMTVEGFSWGDWTGFSYLQTMIHFHIIKLYQSSVPNHEGERYCDNC